MTNGLVLGFAILVMGAIALYLVGSLVRSIQDERKKKGVKRVWANFGLSIAFCIMFFLSWFAQGLVEWEEYKNDQRTHGEPVQVSEYAVQFSRATLENWQSEFLQLFSFVVMSALLIHHGSAESKDSDERMERKIDEIHAAVNAGSRS